MVPLVNIFVGEVVLGEARPLRDVLLHRHRGLRCGSDGWADTGVPGKKIEAREIKYAAIGALRPDAGACAHGPIGGDPLRSRVGLQSRRARLHGSSLRVHIQTNNNGSFRLRRDELLR
jgi:hypothetical protein